MPARIASHSHRHFKTLIVLVFSMTGATFSLFWLANLSPVTPLRARPIQTLNWHSISVHAEKPGDARGFFHFRIDEAGKLYQTSAWKAGQPSANLPGAIHILLSADNGLAKPTTAQTASLSRTISELRRRYSIGESRVHVDRGEEQVETYSASFFGR